MAGTALSVVVTCVNGTGTVLVPTSLSNCPVFFVRARFNIVYRIRYPHYLVPVLTRNIVGFQNL